MLVVALFVACACATSFAGATRVGNLQEQMKAANTRIDGSQKSLGEAIKSYQKAANELRETKEKISSTEKALEEIDARIESDLAALDRHADFMYRTQGIGYLEMIFAANTVGEFADSLEWMMYVASNDAKLVTDLKRETTRQAQALDELNSLRLGQEKTAADLKNDVAKAQLLLNSEQAQADALNSAIGEALERERLAANERAAAVKKPAPPSDTGNSDNSSYTGTGMTFTGIASWYGKGKGTASGERFNPQALTAAHKTLPFGTLVKVTYKGKSVVVRINDRGPYSHGRVIDITVRAAEIIGMKSAGVGQVTCEVVTK
jgi:rare lipoprotein A